MLRKEKCNIYLHTVDRHLFHSFAWKKEFTRKQQYFIFNFYIMEKVIL